MDTAPRNERFESGLKRLQPALVPTAVKSTGTISLLTPHLVAPWPGLVIRLIAYQNVNSTEIFSGPLVLQASISGVSEEFADGFTLTFHPI